MVFELDTKDMERHAVELRLYIEKAKRRFVKAQMVDQYERIIHSALPKDQEADEGLIINHITDEEARRLNSYLERLITKCYRREQHEMLQKALRDSLYKSRRQSVLAADGSQFEPVCFFCAQTNIHDIGLMQSSFMEMPLETTATQVEAAAATIVDQALDISDHDYDCHVQPKMEPEQENVANLNGFSMKQFTEQYSKIINGHHTNQDKAQDLVMNKMRVRTKCTPKRRFFV